MDIALAAMLLGVIRTDERIVLTHAPAPIFIFRASAALPTAGAIQVQLDSGRVSKKSENKKLRTEWEALCYGERSLDLSTSVKGIYY